MHPLFKNQLLRKCVYHPCIIAKTTSLRMFPINRLETPLPRNSRNRILVTFRARASKNWRFSRFLDGSLARHVDARTPHSDLSRHFPRRSSVTKTRMRSLHLRTLYIYHRVIAHCESARSLLDRIFLFAFFRRSWNRPLERLFSRARPRARVWRKARESIRPICVRRD